MAKSATFSEVCWKLGVRAVGNTLTLVSRYVREYGLDTSHMKGKGHGTGDELDNRRENLRFACPNCHRQTETWGRT